MVKRSMTIAGCITVLGAGFLYLHAAQQKATQAPRSAPPARSTPAASPAPVAARAQLPGGLPLPTGGFSKDALLAQAKEMVADLVSMKSSGKLASEQTKQVDELLPKARSLTSELEKPQVETGKLPQLASDMSDLQKQVSALKGMLK